MDGGRRNDGELPYCGIRERSSIPRMGIRVLLVDDHKMMRDGLRVFLCLQPDMDVVAEATDGSSAVRKAAEVSPDVILMDLLMSGISGVDATRRILAADPGARVVVLSAYDDGRAVAEAFGAGARGYVVKDAAYEELAGAIRAVMGDEIYLSPRLVPWGAEGTQGAGAGREPA